MVLLRAMIRSIIMEGMIVPSEITVNLLKKEIHSSGNIKVLIDGFPRNEENRIAFERIVSFSQLHLLVHDINAFRYICSCCVTIPSSQIFQCFIIFYSAIFLRSPFLLMFQTYIFSNIIPNAIDILEYYF